MISYRYIQRDPIFLAANAQIHQFSLTFLLKEIINQGSLLVLEGKDEGGGRISIFKVQQGMMTQIRDPR